MNANNRHRKDFHTLPLADRDLLQSLGYTDRISAVDHAIFVNAEFLNHVIASPEIFSGQYGGEDEHDLKGIDQEDSDDNRAEGSSSTPCMFNVIGVKTWHLRPDQLTPIVIHILIRTGLTPIHMHTNTMLQVLLVCMVDKGRSGNISRPNTIWTNCTVRSSSLSEIGASR